MAGPRYPWAKKTNTGRVVYDRPKHVWTQNDVKRILASVAEAGPPEGANASQWFADFLKDILEVLWGKIGPVIGLNNFTVDDLLKITEPLIYDLPKQLFGIDLRAVDAKIGEALDGLGQLLEEEEIDGS